MSPIFRSENVLHWNLLSNLGYLSRGRLGRNRLLRLGECGQIALSIVNDGVKLVVAKKVGYVSAVIAPE